jgi:hypothetical protein
MKHTKLIRAALRVAQTHPEFKHALKAELQKIGAVDSKCVSPADMRDAREVSKDVLMEYWKQFFGWNLDLEHMLTQRCNVQWIPLNRVIIHKDWGRRPKGKNLKNPIVVLPIRDKFMVLDGQHRVIALRESNVEKVRAVVIQSM